jgi:hypothetical protein
VARRTRWTGSSAPVGATRAAGRRSVPSRPPASGNSPSTRREPSSSTPVTSPTSCSSWDTPGPRRLGRRDLMRAAAYRERVMVVHSRDAFNRVTKRCRFPLARHVKQYRGRPVHMVRPGGGRLPGGGRRAVFNVTERLGGLAQIRPPCTPHLSFVSLPSLASVFHHQGSVGRTAPRGRSSSGQATFAAKGSSGNVAS